jgi:hypothetical protein
MPAMLHMNAIGDRGIPRIDSEFWAAMSHFVRRSHITVLFAAFVTTFPAFSQNKSRDLATFLSGYLTATGQFQNYYDGSTRGVPVDIYGGKAGNLGRRAAPMPRG